MGKTKSLEKKMKPIAEFDKKNPESRKKSMKDIKKKPKLKADNEESEPKIAKKKFKKSKVTKELILKEIIGETDKDAGNSDELPEKLVKRDIVKKALISLKSGIEKEIEANSAKNIFGDELRLGLQIVSTKIPNCPSHTKRILLDHSLHEQQPDICFIIRDKAPKKGDQSENIREFEAKLAQFEITGIKTIIPVTQLKQDYKTYNMKLKLCNTYDMFFVEPEIAEHVYSLLGKAFIKKRKRPFQIDTTKNAEVMKFSIEKAHRKVSFKLSASSSVTVFEVGTIKMDNTKIADNIMTGIEQLKEKWPGGWRNISRLYLKPMKPSKVSIPIYYSKINPNDVEVPVIKGDKQTRIDKIAQKLESKSKKFQLDKSKKQIIKAKANIVDKSKKEKVADAAEKKSDKPKQKDKKRKKEIDEENKSSSAEQPLKKKKKKVAEPDSDLDWKSIINLEKKIKKKKKKEKDVEESETASPEKDQKPKKDKKKKRKRDSCAVN